MWCRSGNAPLLVTLGLPDIRSQLDRLGRGGGGLWRGWAGGAEGAGEALGRGIADIVVLAARGVRQRKWGGRLWARRRRRQEGCAEFWGGVSSALLGLKSQLSKASTAMVRDGVPTDFRGIAAAGDGVAGLGVLAGGRHRHAAAAAAADLLRIGIATDCLNHRL